MLQGDQVEVLVVYGKELEVTGYLSAGKPSTMQRLLSFYGGVLLNEFEIRETFAVLIHEDVLNCTKLALALLLHVFRNVLVPFWLGLLSWVEHILEQDTLRRDWTRWTKQPLIEGKGGIKGNIQLFFSLALALMMMMMMI